MKGKLTKYKNGYILSAISNGWIIGSTDHEYVSNHKGEQIVYKLSKQSCDEIFGVVNVEKLAEEFVNDLQVASETVNRAVKLGYEEGFNKAMELNGDKQFTLEDMKRAIDKAKQGSVKETHNGYGRPTEPRFVLDDLSYDEIIQSLQPPTEIEVEIEVTKSDDIKSVEKDWYKIGEPKLDENGCLILKRI